MSKRHDLHILALTDSQRHYVARLHDLTHYRITATLISEYPQYSERKPLFHSSGSRSVSRHLQNHPSPPPPVTSAETPLEDYAAMFCSIFLLQAILLEFCAAGYNLETSYTSTNWFDQFSFYTVGSLIPYRMHDSDCTHPLSQSADPTHGYVNYVNQTTATSNGYINTDNDLVYMGVDSTNVATGSGRDSVRIISNAAYNYGLFALDVAHMPGGICGTWQVFPILFFSRSEF